LIHWTKYGPAFQEALGGKYASRWSKSAGIVTRLDETKGRLIAAKIDGKYWIYWGEGTVYLATSTDLIHWTPVENEKGGLQVLLASSTGRFDSSFAEGGPPPVLTKAGIVLIYNGRNAEKDGDPKLGASAYAAGEDAGADRRAGAEAGAALREDGAACGGNDLQRGVGLLQRAVAALLRLCGFVGERGDGASRTGRSCVKLASMYLPRSALILQVLI
jgi:beta-1,4-mannooligosaccharide phosphorylase